MPPGARSADRDRRPQQPRSRGRAPNGPWPNSRAWRTTLGGKLQSGGMAANCFSNSALNAAASVSIVAGANRAGSRLMLSSRAAADTKFQSPCPMPQQLYCSRRARASVDGKRFPRDKAKMVAPASQSLLVASQGRLVCRPSGKYRFRGIVSVRAMRHKPAHRITKEIV